MRALSCSGCVRGDHVETDNSAALRQPFLLAFSFLFSIRSGGGCHDQSTGIALSPGAETP